MKLYGLGLSAVKVDKRGMKSGVGAAYAFASSDDEALGKAHRMARQLFPESLGWGQWMVAVGAAGDDDIREAYRLLGDA